MNDGASDSVRGVWFAGPTGRGRAVTRACSASGETALTAPTLPRDTIERQSARAPERQSARAPERQSAIGAPAPSGCSGVTAPSSAPSASRRPGRTVPERHPAGDGRRPSPPPSRFSAPRLAQAWRAGACAFAAVVVLLLGAASEVEAHDGTTGHVHFKDSGVGGCATGCPHLPTGWVEPGPDPGQVTLHWTPAGHRSGRGQLGCRVAPGGRRPMDRHDPRPPRRHDQPHLHPGPWHGIRRECTRRKRRPRPAGSP